jgi:NAD(P)H-quinone oxidoreductase subunit H
MGEMRESVKILRQAIDHIPGGAYESLEANRLAAGVKSEWDGFDYQYISKKIAPTFKIPAGEHYVRVESGKGELSHNQSGYLTVFRPNLVLSQTES